MYYNLLDVAVGPIYAIIGVFAFIVLAIVAAILYFAVKTIRNIKRKENNNDGH